MLALQLATAVVGFVIILHLVVIARTGRDLKRERITLGFYQDVTLAYKWRVVWRAIIWSLGALILIELQIQFSSAPYESGWLLYGHWAIDAVVVATIVLIMWPYTGVKNRNVHRTLVYTLYYVEIPLAAGSGALLLTWLPV